MAATVGQREVKDIEERAALRTWLRLLTCTNLIEKRIRVRLRLKFATTLPRFDVLAQLDAAERETKRGLTMSELSRHLMVTNGNLTGLTEHLVQEHLVSREVSPNDRRTQYVRLTPAGKRVLNSMLPHHRQWVDAMFSGLTRQDHATLYKLIAKLKESVLAVPEEESQ